MQPQRRHDIDALRALAFGLLILYHWGMLYVGGDDWDWHLKSTHLAEWLQLPMLAVNRWRMDLIFLISGLSVHFLLRDTRIGRFLVLRSWRLLLPLTFGMWVVVPIQPYAEGVANGLVEPGFFDFLVRYYGHTAWPEGAFAGWEHGFTWNHLWYLAYLWTYTCVFALLLPVLRRVPNPLARLRGAWLLVLPALPLAVFTLLLQPHFDDTGDLVNDWYRHSIYFTVFLYGWWLGTHEGVWSELVRLRRRALLGAVALFAVYVTLALALPEDVGDAMQSLIWILRNLYIWWMLCAILGYGRAYLNRPFRWLPWANEAVYPWYMLHQSLIVAFAYWLLPMHLGPIVEPALVLIGTVAGCALLHAVIRRSAVLRPLFGLKRRRQASAASMSFDKDSGVSVGA
ncbi:MAG: acyltransferase family protein [Lysobacter sp.]|nr:acyltransferase family protein [Lysobacter sp.]